MGAARTPSGHGNVAGLWLLSANVAVLVLFARDSSQQFLLGEPQQCHADIVRIVVKAARL